MGLVHHDKGERSINPRFPIAPQHQIELFGRCDQNAKLALRLTLLQHPGFMAIEFQRRADFFHHNTDRLEISFELSGQLVYQGACWCQVGDPPPLVVELIECLKNSKFSYECFSARSWELHHNRAASQAQETLFA